ncbi:MAG: hypothetical protein U9R34_01900 [Nanoarchaeota archaeon]|nr:hypothetical protein [Nanoarchaeota archaeon]
MITNNIGRLELLIGNMSSGKSTFMNDILLRNVIMGKKVQLFQPVPSIRDIDDPNLIARGGYSIIRESIADTDEIYKKVKQESEVIGFDELQFYNEKIINTIKYLINEGKEVLACSLELDFRGNSLIFGEGPEGIYDLLPIADKVQLFNSICTHSDNGSGKVCGNTEARWVQKYYGDDVAPYETPLIELGDIRPGRGVWYAPRCRKHFKFYDNREGK